MISTYKGETMDGEKWFRSWEEEKARGRNSDGTWRTGPYTKEIALLLGIGIVIMFGITICLIWR